MKNLINFIISYENLETPKNKKYKGHKIYSKKIQIFQCCHRRLQTEAREENCRGLNEELRKTKQP